MYASVFLLLAAAVSHFFANSAFSPFLIQHLGSYASVHVTQENDTVVVAPEYFEPFLMDSLAIYPDDKNFTFDESVVWHIKATDARWNPARMEYGSAVAGFETLAGPKPLVFGARYWVAVVGTIGGINRGYFEYGNASIKEPDRDTK